MVFELYQDVVTRYAKLSREGERKLIKSAQMGDEKAIEELLLRQIGFFKLRIRAILFPVLVKRYGDDILQECLLLASKKVHTFNLRYRNKQGRLSRVYFRTYLWKAVTGLILQIINKNKHEIMFSDLSIVDIAWQQHDGQKVSFVFGPELE